MDVDWHIWRVWARFLHRWGLEGFVAAFLSAAGPLTVIGAQVVYIGQPILDGFLPNGHMDALARLLEDANRTEEFVRYLREAPPQ